MHGEIHAPINSKVWKSLAQCFFSLQKNHCIILTQHEISPNLQIKMHFIVLQFLKKHIVHMESIDLCVWVSILSCDCKSLHTIVCTQIGFYNLISLCTLHSCRLSLLLPLDIICLNFSLKIRNWKMFHLGWRTSSCSSSCDVATNLMLSECHVPQNKNCICKFWNSSFIFFLKFCESFVLYKSSNCSSDLHFQKTYDKTKTVDF